MIHGNVGNKTLYHVRTAVQMSVRIRAVLITWSFSSRRHILQYPVIL